MGDISKAGVARIRSGNAATRPNNPNMEHLGKTLLSVGWILNVVGAVDKMNSVSMISFSLSSTCTILAIIHYALSIREKTKRK